jgi:hypothetical protein
VNEGVQATGGEAADAEPGAPSSEPASRELGLLPPPDDRATVVGEPAPEGAAGGEQSPTEHKVDGPPPPLGESTSESSLMPAGDEDVDRNAAVVVAPEAADPRLDRQPEGASERDASTPSQPTGDEDARVSEDG